MFVDTIVRPNGASGFFFVTPACNRWLDKAKVGLLGVAIAVLLTACGTELDAPLESLAAVPPPPPIASVSGRVTDAADSAVIAGAVVTIGSATAVTDATGHFLLSDVPAASRTMVRVTAPGYADAFPVVATILGFTTNISVQLLPVGVVAPISVAAGGVVTVPGSLASMDIPASSLVLADGSPAAGSVNVTVTPIDVAQDLALMPGDFVESTDAPIESFGAIVVHATDSGGGAVELADGQTAIINIPLTSRNTDPPLASLALFYFDELTGKWVSQGTATLMGSAPNQYYQGTINHLGIWTASQVISPTIFLNGCVNKEGSTTAVANVRVQAEGISYSGMSSAITGTDGTFRMAIKPNASVIVNGMLGNFVTNTFSAGPSGSEITMPVCLSLAALSGAPRITLTWGLDPEDVDSHIFAPDGTHVSYIDKGTLAADPYIKLDVDDVTSFGPEVVTLTRLMVGTYTYGVRNFTGSHSPGLTGSPVRVELRRGEELTVFKPTVAMGETASDDWWTIFTMTVDAQCNVTVTPVNVFSSGGDDGPGSPARPPIVARQYCVSP